MKFLSFFLVLLFPLLSNAQISLGVIAGSNIGKFGGVETSDDTYNYRSGLNFGASIAYRINNEISIKIQPMYSQRGSDVGLYHTGSDLEYDGIEIYEIELDYLVLPFLIAVDLDNGITYFISGLEFGVPLSAQVSENGNNHDLSETFNQIDILASIGVGLRYSIGKPDLLFEFRYYQGLVNLNTEAVEYNGEIIYANVKNTGFQLMVGLEWEL